MSVLDLKDICLWASCPQAYAFSTSPLAHKYKDILQCIDNAARLTYKDILKGIELSNRINPTLAPLSFDRYFLREIADSTLILSHHAALVAETKIATKTAAIDMNTFISSVLVGPQKFVLPVKVGRRTIMITLSVDGIVLGKQQKRPKLYVLTYVNDRSPYISFYTNRSLEFLLKSYMLPLACKKILQKHNKTEYLSNRVSALLLWSKKGTCTPTKFSQIDTQRFSDIIGTIYRGMDSGVSYTNLTRDCAKCSFKKVCSSTRITLED